MLFPQRFNTHCQQFLLFLLFKWLQEYSVGGARADAINAAGQARDDCNKCNKWLYIVHAMPAQPGQHGADLVRQLSCSY